ncbi:MAG: hypothetical protein HC924_05525 [Synechococcaceae cyanobacterium SM2_3_2]|nr:hypothetical protein [Synechococcaceae cyanobacterium SM2_3_2]
MLSGFRPELDRWIPWESVSLPSGLDLHQMRARASANRAERQEQRIEDIVEQLSETTTRAPQGSLVRIPIYEPSQGLNGYLNCQATNGYLSCQGRVESF